MPVDHSRPFLDIIRELAGKLRTYPERLIEQFETIPRDLFVPEELRETFLPRVQTNEGCAGLLSQPAVIFLMLAILQLEGTEAVFEAGTGTGYQTAILARLASHIYTVERDLKRLEEAKKRLTTLGISNVTFIHGDAAEGLPDSAPFDRMIFGAALHGLVDTQLTNQMVPQLSRLVAPSGNYDQDRKIVVGDLLICDKREGEVFQKITTNFAGTLTFVPLISQRPSGWTLHKGRYIPTSQLPQKPRDWWLPGRRWRREPQTRSGVQVSRKGQV